jgi:hypothetical protein
VNKHLFPFFSLHFDRQRKMRKQDRAVIVKKHGMASLSINKGIKNATASTHKYAG